MTPEHDKPTHEIGHSEALVYIAKLRSANLSMIAQVEALTVPQGFVSMPTSPSEAVLQPYGWPRMEYARYRAMLDAAPTIPAIPGTKEGA